MASITSANAVIVLTVTGLFGSTQLQGFSADDVFDTNDLANAEVLMGVDGKLSAGFVYVPVVQNYMFQADSSSNDLFDAWYGAEQQAKDKYFATAVITLPATGKSYTMNRGVLSSYKPIPDAKKYLQPRKYTITWESMLPSPDQ